MTKQFGVPGLKVCFVKLNFSFYLSVLAFLYIVDDDCYRQQWNGLDSMEVLQGGQSTEQ